MGARPRLKRACPGERAGLFSRTASGCHRSSCWRCCWLASFRLVARLAASPTGPRGSSWRASSYGTVFSRQ